ncbi:hypothetical protein SRHO_G00339870 [Serrasalmus rhombeus]
MHGCIRVRGRTSGKNARRARTDPTPTQPIQCHMTGTAVQATLRGGGGRGPGSNPRTPGMPPGPAPHRRPTPRPGRSRKRDVIPVSKENVISSKDLEKWPYLRNVDIKEIDADVELLIGVNTPKAMEPWEIINSIGNGPYAVRTMLGWIVNGPLGSMGDVTNHHVVTTNRISVSEIEELLIKQYNQEFPETHYTEKREMSLDDKKFMKILTEQVTYENSHYYLPLPFRNDNVMMPNNREVAIRRAASLAKRLKGDKSYKQFMDKMLEQDYAEKIPLDQLHVVEGKIWYVPHHGVYHRRKGTLRVVFDCTSSFQNTSLNKELLQGPDLTNNLLGVLMQFRQGHIALMADIQAMFHQVRVHRKHVDFLRFLWWPDGDFEKQPEDYRMKVHLFGAISSPSCANFALQKTAQDNQHNYDKEWNHFKRALAWFLRLKDILKTKIQGKDAVKINSAQNVGSQCLSVDELERAENAVISYVQNSSFHEEVEALQWKPNISSLDPILENGILRVLITLGEKKGRGTAKRYGVIFTCLVSRAIHLEVANSLDTDACINALRRFICRRGPVATIRTDQGTNFIGSHRELDNSLKNVDHEKIHETLTKDGIKWMFNPPFAPHHGGVWERLIKSLKKILHSLFREQILDDDGLLTALCEVETIMNDRPLTTVSDDPLDLEPLTPNHLLRMKVQPVIPPGIFQSTDLYVRRRWKQVQYITDLFWKRWIREYLPIMQKRSKWNLIKRNFLPNDLVVIVDDKAPRNSWLLGRILKTFPDKQGLVRAALIKTKNTVLQRPVSKLCLLMETSQQ